MSEVWAEARVEMSQLLRVQEKSQGFSLCKDQALAGKDGDRIAAALGMGALKWEEVPGYYSLLMEERCKVPGTGWPESRARSHTSRRPRKKCPHCK